MGILDAVFLIGIVAFALMSAGFMDEGCTWLKIIGRETRQSGLPRVLPWSSPDGDFGNPSPPLLSSPLGRLGYRSVRHVCLPSARGLLHPRSTTIHAVSCYGLINPRNGTDKMSLLTDYTPDVAAYSQL